MNHKFKFHIFSDRKSQTGFSLVETMVVVAIMGVVALGMASLISSVSNQQSHLTKVFEKQKVFDTLRATISAPDKCAQMLGIEGVALTNVATPVATITDINTLTGDRISTTVAQDGLKAAQISIDLGALAGSEIKQEPSSLYGAGAIVANYERVGAQLKVSMMKEGATSGSFSNFREESFPIILLRNPTRGNSIDFCYSGGISANDSVCVDQFGGAMDNAKGIKCRVPKFVFGNAHTNEVANPNGASAMIENIGRIFSSTTNGSASLFLQAPQSATGSSPNVYDLDVSALPSRQAEIRFSALTNQLEIRPPNNVSGTAPTLTFNSSKNASFDNLNVQIGNAPGTALTVSGNGAVTGTLSAGATTVNSLLVSTTSTVTGASTFNGLLTANAAITVNGAGPSNFAHIVNAPSFITPSDRRLKYDIRQVEDALNKISQVQGVTYLMKNGAPEGRQMGVIAQEIQKVFPESVIVTPNGFLAVNYNSLTGALIEAVKELKTNQEDQKSEMLSQIQELKAELRQIKRELSSQRKGK